jgi:DNA (cytosine-5)-methyltransferase 1
MNTSQLINQGGARMSSGKDSKQDYETPQPLVDALGKLFNLPVDVDLAATVDNTKAPLFITPEENSLKISWWERFGKRLCFLNPPFFDIAPWASKCNLESKLGSRILFLTPASVDSNWWDAYVHQTARVLFIQPRIKFIGAKDPYPKPCSVSCYNLNLPLWYQPWRWI